MDLIKKLTGKNPNEYEQAAKMLVDNSDTELFQNLVSQDDFLFDFIKNNAAQRIQNACNENNYQNLLNFTEYYSQSYDTMIAQTLYRYGGKSLYDKIKSLLFSGTDAQKAYAVKYFYFVPEPLEDDVVEVLRDYSKSDFEPLSINSVEILSKIKDDVSLKSALENLKSEDEFVQYDAVKFLAVYQAKEALPQIIEVMKKSSLAENIASEIPYIISFSEFYQLMPEECILVLCHIINGIPEIISPQAITDFNLYDIFQKLYSENLTSASALLLRLAKDKFEELLSNEEYLFDCDKRTKDTAEEINKFLSKINSKKLESLLYEELYEESDFVFFAVEYANETEELETLLDGKNQTLILKVLTLLKEKNVLTNLHKETALKNITADSIKSIAEVL